MSFLLGLPTFRGYVKFPGCTFFGKKAATVHDTWEDDAKVLAAFHLGPNFYNFFGERIWGDGSF